MIQGETIRFRWTLTRADHLDALRASSPAVRFAPWFAAGLGVVAVVLALLGQWLPAVFGIVIAIPILILPYWQAGVSEREYPFAGKEIRASADGNRLRLDVATRAHSEVRWATVRGWTNTGRTIVLRTGEPGGYPIPLRAFSEPEQAAAFVALLESAVRSGAEQTDTQRESPPTHNPPDAEEEPPR